MYPYTPLQGSSPVRFFELLPGDEGSILRGKIAHGDLERCPSYEAISYVWGSEADMVSLECDGARLKITQNLAAALQRFRLTR